MENITTVKKDERLIKILSMDEIYDGIYNVKYAIAKQDGKGGYVTKILNGKEEFVWLKMDTPYSKTVIDTSKISIDVAEEWSKQAFLNSDIEIVTSARGTYSLRLTGSANNGVDFIGWIDMESWELISFYPVE